MNSDVLKFVGKSLWKPILQYGLTMLTIWFIPNINLVTINLCILVWIYIFKLFDFSEPPSFKDWMITTTPRTVLTVSAFYILYSWLGAFGVIGAIILILGIAAWQIFANWKLYDAATTWGAQRLFKGSKEDFDFKKALENDKKQTEGEVKNE